MSSINSKIKIFFLLFIAVGSIYVFNTWSPSSYAHALKNHFGYESIEPDFGKPRAVRSDEWAVVTPLTQAAVRNDFKRYNETSLYREDLRINYGIPIADWGIIFKPTMWLYGLVNPAYAYSAHWFLIFSLFIFGYTILFKKFGATYTLAIALSFGLYFTGFSQFWWNEKGPLFAIFPWVIIPLISNMKLIWKVTAFYYTAVFWLLTNLYPPIQISLAFVGFIIILTQQPKIFTSRKIIYILIAAALAAGTAGYYLKDYLMATSATLYPGGRHSMGGEVPFRFILSWFFPGFNFTWSYNSLIGLNMSEIGVVGMYYYIAIAFFLNYKNFHNIWQDPQQKRVFLALAIGFNLQLAWMVLPIPSRVGMIFLWDNVQPSRMQFASGVLLALIASYTANKIGLIFSLKRFALLAVFIIISWWIFKKPFGVKRTEDLFFLPILFVAYLIFKKYRNSAHELVAISSLIFGIALFGRFNPLQSAWPIFNTPNNQTVQYLQELQKFNNGTLVYPGLPGAIANGMGFRSLSHVTATPHMDFWRKNFPELPNNELNHIFNRYSHINPTLALKPTLLQADAVLVPMSRFTHNSRATEISQYEHNLSQHGFFTVEKQNGILLINGWGGWPRDAKRHDIEIMFDHRMNQKIEVSSILRPDLPINTNQRISALNGFQIMIQSENTEIPRCITVIAVDDAGGGRTILNNPPSIPLCQSPSP
ncbi:DUF7657 domain-containing protein [Comamonas sp.]|uniref:DUF7657 domain-containing protein n=1 Tax=Comamonas sp. TaxID=34028 RepID=UPI003D13898C